jgi:hypothetical protein
MGTHPHTIPHDGHILQYLQHGSTHSRVHDPVRVGPTAVDERHGWRDIENLRTRNAQEGEHSNEGTHGSLYSLGFFTVRKSNPIDSWKVVVKLATCKLMKLEKFKLSRKKSRVSRVCSEQPQRPAGPEDKNGLHQTNSERTYIQQTNHHGQHLCTRPHIDSRSGRDCVVRVREWQHFERWCRAAWPQH